MGQPFDVEQLDPEDPFEIDDGNAPHLYKHIPTQRGRHVAVGIEDIYDVYVADWPLFYEADVSGPADWLMIGEVPGLTLIVPLAPPNSGDPTRCRPIGLYSAGEKQRVKYYSEVDNYYGT